MHRKVRVLYIVCSIGLFSCIVVVVVVIVDSTGRYRQYFVSYSRSYVLVI